ncbi:MAG: TonB-dependent receptor [Bacteroidales bacterium]|nr:TonB-dependent receptor [Bacteroidales bacterium]
MKIFINIIFLSSLCFFLNAQVLTVKDRVTHQPIEFAAVYSRHPSASTLTDAKGRADMTAFRDADSILIRYMGYEPVTVSYNQLKDEQFIWYMEPSEISLEAVKVIATRWIQERSGFPNRIASVKPLQITLQNPQTMADLLGSTGEIFIQKSQLGGGSPMIRGFAANRVMIVVDGVRMNNAVFRSGNLQNIISVDPLSVHTAEVIFGPGSVIYGSDAIGGVMSFHTLRPSLAAKDKIIIKGSALSRYSTANNEKTGHFDLCIGLNRWSFISSLTFSDFDDMNMGSDGPEEYLREKYVDRINGKDSMIINTDPEKQVPSGYRQLNLMQRIRFKPGENLDINYGFHYSTTTDVPRYDRLIEYRGSILRDGEWYYGPQKWMMQTITLKVKGSNKLYDTQSSTLAYQHFEESRHNRGFDKDILTHRTEIVKVFSLNSDFEKTISDKYLINYGGEILFNMVGSEAEDENLQTRDTEETSTRYPDGSVWHSCGLYLTYKYQASEALVLSSGIRFNHAGLHASFDTTFYPFPFSAARLNKGTFTGSTGVLYRPELNLLIGLNLSTGFRAPNIDDLGKVFDSEPGSVLVPNPGLRHEYAWHAEMNAVKTFGKSLKLELSGYFTLLNGAMVRRDFNLNGADSILYDGEPSRVQAIQNAARAWVWGIQAAVNVKIPAGFGVSSQLNFQKGKEELDDGSVAPLRHAAPLFGTAHLTYSANRFKADLYGIYNAEITFENLAPSEQGKPHLYASDKNGHPYSPEWYTVNFKALYQLTDFLMISAGIENITDQRYRPYSSGIAGAGRNLIISAKVTF